MKRKIILLCVLSVLFTTSSFAQKVNSIVEENPLFLMKAVLDSPDLFPKLESTKKKMNLVGLRLGLNTLQDYLTRHYPASQDQIEDYVDKIKLVKKIKNVLLDKTGEKEEGKKKIIDSFKNNTNKSKNIANAFLLDALGENIAEHEFQNYLATSVSDDKDKSVAQKIWNQIKNSKLKTLSNFLQKKKMAHNAVHWRADMMNAPLKNLESHFLGKNMNDNQREDLNVMDRK